ncbi:MAG: hypothetical protein IKZ92_01275 [Muribaculaceae bacterium]|nr:hypothetical protein [Muribaculaceae bacterium]
MSIWRNIFCVITAPKYGWEVINESNIPVGKVLRSAYIPLLVVLALSCFVPKIYDSTITFSYSLMSGIVMFSTYFISYYIIIYLLGGFYPELVKTEGATARLNDYILYNLIFLVLLIILRNLLPSDFTPVLFLMVYLPWMAYRGTDHLFVKKDKVAKFVFISSALLLGLPLALKTVLDLFVIK